MQSSTMRGDTETYRETPLFWIDSKIQVTSKIILTKHWDTAIKQAVQNSLITTENFAGDQFESEIFLNRSDNFHELNYDYLLSNYPE